MRQIQVFNDYDFLARHQVRARRPSGMMMFVIDAVTDFLPNPNGTTLLDMGGGTNSHLTHISEDYRRIVTDCSAEAIAGLSSVETIHALLPRTGLPDGMADLVSACAVIEHLPPQIYNESLKELARLTNRFTVITGPFHQHLESAYVKCRQCGIEYQCEGHFRRFELKEIEKLQNHFGGIVRLGFWGARKPLTTYRLHYRLKQVRYLLRRLGLIAYPAVPFTKCPACQAEEFNAYESYVSNALEPNQDYWVVTLPCTGRTLVGEHFMVMMDKNADPVELV